MNKYYLTRNIQFPDTCSTVLIRKYVSLIFSIKLLCNGGEGLSVDMLPTPNPSIKYPLLCLGYSFLREGQQFLRLLQTG